VKRLRRPKREPASSNGRHDEPSAGPRTRDEVEYLERVRDYLAGDMSGPWPERPWEGTRDARAGFEDGHGGGIERTTVAGRGTRLEWPTPTTDFPSSGHACYGCPGATSPACCQHRRGDAR
jgi:hypothetical protein